ncbi:hypothetical protein pdam_00007460 [Pocillopora damicornis]|uniref:Uncharacterized protein n=1 Tax=Pocillopora damicornis TaxID=46731 RepID=A0A3M6UN91_POCDA|nr:uncharacterized protein C5orf49-like isoform X1 [Pocillopora damicornis]RMX55157.1 hypothetical protein pdam_00007460 [Pocillopora damicornis]
MAATTRESPSSRYPSEKSVKEALDMLKPPGILSKAYNQFQLKRYQREDAIRKNHVVTTGGEGVADSWKVERPKSLDLAQDTSYFLAKTAHQRPSTYDRINHVVEGYDQKLHRDDREHAKSRGLTVNREEIRVPVPARSSSVYGHPRLKPLEFTDRKHVRVEICKKDFLRLGGTNIGDAD